MYVCGVVYSTYMMWCYYVRGMYCVQHHVSMSSYRVVDSNNRVVDSNARREGDGSKWERLCTYIIM